MNDIVTISGMVLGLVSVFSQAGLPSKLKPIFAVAIGIGVSFLIGGEGWRAIITSGIIGSLTASGLWAGSKTMVKKSEVEDPDMG